MATITVPQLGRSMAPVNEDRVLLDGPHSRTKELWLVVRAVRDFISGFRTLHFVGPCVTVFGSARYQESHPYYALGRQVGAALSRLGFTVMTGGGPGLMEAANRGARESGGRSVGCNIELPKDVGSRRQVSEGGRARSGRMPQGRQTGPLNHLREKTVAVTEVA